MAKVKKDGLTAKHKIGYALGDMGGCMTFALMGAYVTRDYTNVLHVDTVVLAALLLIWNVWDAVNDPMMGALMDKMFAKKANPKGKFRPWLLRATPLQSHPSFSGLFLHFLKELQCFVYYLYVKFCTKHVILCSTFPWDPCCPLWRTPIRNVHPCLLHAALVP